MCKRLYIIIVLTLLLVAAICPSLGAQAEDIIFKIAAVGILVAILNQLLNKAGKEEIAMMTTIAGLIIVLLMVIDMISGLFETIRQIFGLF